MSLIILNINRFATSPLVHSHYNLDPLRFKVLLPLAQLLHPGASKQNVLAETSTSYSMRRYRAPVWDAAIFSRHGIVAEEQDTVVGEREADDGGGLDEGRAQVEDGFALCCEFADVSCVEDCFC